MLCSEVHWALSRAGSWMPRAIHKDPFTLSSLFSGTAQWNLFLPLQLLRHLLIMFQFPLCESLWKKTFFLVFFFLNNWPGWFQVAATGKFGNSESPFTTGIGLWQYTIASYVPCSANRWGMIAVGDGTISQRTPDSMELLFPLRSLGFSFFFFLLIYVIITLYVSL